MAMIGYRAHDIMSLSGLIDWLVRQTRTLMRRTMAWVGKGQHREVISLVFVGTEHIKERLVLLFI